MNNIEFQNNIILIEDKIDAINELVCEFNLGIERELNIILEELQQLRSLIESNYEEKITG